MILSRVFPSSRLELNIAHKDLQPFVCTNRLDLLGISESSSKGIIPFVSLAQSEVKSK